MSRLLRTTTCNGKPGLCKVQLNRNIPPSSEGVGLNIQKLETRLYQIHADLKKLHPQDVHRARVLQADAEATAAAVRTANRGELTINVTHILNRINDMVKSGFGKIGEFFTHLSQRQATVDVATPLETEEAIIQAEKQRFLHSFRFRKQLPSL